MAEPAETPGRLYVHQSGCFTAAPPASPADLKRDLQQRLGQPLRRLSKFTLLALAGALDCMAGALPPEGAGVYLTTRNGNVTDTLAVLDQIHTERGLPLPVSFIQTLNNIAAFYVARFFNCSGPNLTLSSGPFPFERGLELLSLALSLGTLPGALIGEVDEAPGHHASGRGEVCEKGIPAAEGSGWMYLSLDAAGAIGWVAEPAYFPNLADARAWAQRLGAEGPDRIAFGPDAAAADGRAWQTALGPLKEFDYREATGCWEAAVACGLARFLMAGGGRELLHVSRDPTAGFALLRIRRL